VTKTTGKGCGERRPRPPRRPPSSPRGAGRPQPPCRGAAQVQSPPAYVERNEKGARGAERWAAPDEEGERRGGRESGALAETTRSPPRVVGAGGRRWQKAQRWSRTRTSPPLAARRKRWWRRMCCIRDDRRGWRLATGRPSLSRTARKAQGRHWRRTRADASAAKPTASNAEGHRVRGGACGQI
jgi:hypothetical protein